MPSELTETDVFVLLSKRRRRLALRILQKHTTPLTVRELTERIGKREYEDPSANNLQTIYLSLYHNHLPKLNQADVVEYDRAEETVRPSLNFDILMSMLDEVSDSDYSWAGQ